MCGAVKPVIDKIKHHHTQGQFEPQWNSDEVKQAYFVFIQPFDSENSDKSPQQICHVKRYLEQDVLKQMIRHSIEAKLGGKDVFHCIKNYNQPDDDEVDVNGKQLV